MVKELTLEELEPKIQARSCRVCNMLTGNLKMWCELHERILMSNHTVAATTDWANAQLDEYKNVGMMSEAEAAHLNYNSVRNHFNKHVATVEIFQRLLKSALNIQASKPRDEATIESHREIQERFGLVWDAVDEFVQLRELVQSEEMRLAMYDARLRAQEEKPGYLTDFKAIKEFQTLVTDHINSRMNLLKLQNSMQVSGKAVEAGIAFVAKAFINEAVQVGSEVSARIQQEHPGTSVSQEVEELIRSRLGDTLKSIVQDAHLAIIKQFGIK